MNLDSARKLELAIACASVGKKIGESVMSNPSAENVNDAIKKLELIENFTRSLENEFSKPDKVFGVIHFSSS